MNADEIRKLRKQANPIAQLMEAMEGTWRERNEPVVTAVRGAGVVIGIDVNQDAGAVFYGKELLERVINRAPFYNPNVGVLVFALDFREGESA